MDSNLIKTEREKCPIPLSIFPCSKPTSCRENLWGWHPPGLSLGQLYRVATAPADHGICCWITMSVSIFGLHNWAGSARFPLGMAARSSGSPGGAYAQGRKLLSHPCLKPLEDVNAERPSEGIRTFLKASRMSSPGGSGMSWVAQGPGMWLVRRFSCYSGLLLYPC